MYGLASSIVKTAKCVEVMLNILEIVKFRLFYGNKFSRNMRSTSKLCPIK